MLKITVDEGARRLVLEGSLSGPWVRTFEDSWRAAISTNAPQKVAVDLTNITFVDRPGMQLLATIHKAGGGLVAVGMNLALVQEIANFARVASAPGRSPRASL